MGEKKKDRREDFLALVPQDARKILDIGCGEGSLSAKLKNEKREIVGVDKDKQACRKAQEKLDKVIVANLDSLKLPYSEEYFDCILYTDVLDCLIEPLSSIKKHLSYLKNGGYIIASMANMRYYKTIIRLALGGTWDYTDGGNIMEGPSEIFYLNKHEGTF